TDTSTAMPGLYVAGEDAGGAHGSNRLGGNGVANSTVFGGIAGDVMADYAAGRAAPAEPDETILADETARAQAPFTQPAGDLHALRDELQDVMWDGVGVIRTPEGMQRAISQLDDLAGKLSQTGLADMDLRFNLTWHDWLNVQSLIETSQVIARTSLQRKDSRGAHFREDFPDAGAPEESRFTTARLDSGELVISDEPVEFTHVRPGETLLKDDIVAAE
ncbi:MAG: FAD-binding protein, partial [Rhizobiales bacterium]|nr:FAD-binding protein [Hyphomicrobiales bacterium]